MTSQLPNLTHWPNVIHSSFIPEHKGVATVALVTNWSSCDWQIRERFKAHHYSTQPASKDSAVLMLGLKMEGQLFKWYAIPLFCKHDTRLQIAAPLSDNVYSFVIDTCSIFFIAFTGSVTPCPFCGTESGGSLVGKCDHTSRSNRTHAGTQQTTLSRLSLADRAWETDDDESLMLGTQITNKTQAHTPTHKRAHTPDACTHTFVSSLLLICSFPFATWCFSLCHQWFCGDGDRWRDLGRIR